MKPGDRVRIVGCIMPENRYLIGREATLIEYTEGINIWELREEMGWKVQPDDHPRQCMFRSEHLVPLTPPPELVDWDEACFDRDGCWKETAAA